MPSRADGALYHLDVTRSQAHVTPALVGLTLGRVEHALSRGEFTLSHDERIVSRVEGTLPRVELALPHDGSTRARVELTVSPVECGVSHADWARARVE